MLVDTYITIYKSYLTIYKARRYIFYHFTDTMTTTLTLTIISAKTVSDKLLKHFWPGLIYYDSWDLS